MTDLNKYLAVLITTIVAAVVILKPVVTNENEYKVVVVNVSEYPIANAMISGPGGKSYDMGTIQPGNIQDYIFKPEHEGVMEYTIKQNSQTLTGVINSELKKGDTGDIFVVLGEMYRVKIHEEFDI